MRLLSLLAIAGAGTLSGCRYDSSPLMFNPAGRVLQVENAVAAVKKNGLPVVGVVFSDGLLLVTKDRADSGSKQTARSSKKFIIVDEHCCIAPSGFAADGIALGKAAKTLAAKHKKEFGRNIPIEVLSEHLADWMHFQTRRGRDTRPLGVSALVAGADEELGFQMYSLEPQGTYQGWKAVCVGGMHCDRNHAILQGALGSTAAVAVVMGEFWSRLSAQGGELLASLFASGPATLGGSDTADNKEDEEVQVFTITRSLDVDSGGCPCPWATRLQRLSLKALPPALV